MCGQLLQGPSKAGIWGLRRVLPTSCRSFTVRVGWFWSTGPDLRHVGICLPLIVGVSLLLLVARPVALRLALPDLLVPLQQSTSSVAIKKDPLNCLGSEGRSGINETNVSGPGKTATRACHDSMPKCTLKGGADSSRPQMRGDGAQTLPLSDMVGGVVTRLFSLFLERVETACLLADFNSFQFMRASKISGCFPCFASEGSQGSRFGAAAAPSRWIP